MSGHYTLLLTLPLLPEAAAANEHALRYVLSDGSRPPSLPDHRFFQVFDPGNRPHAAYQDFDPGTMQSAFWLYRNEDGSPQQAGVNLFLPGNKLEGVVEDLFPLLDWLASLSNAHGSVGIVLAEDVPRSEPFVFYVRDQRLFVGTAVPGEAQALDDGSPYQSELESNP